ncbi:hypothetical protein HMPREF3033_01843 [Veillonellaceae bacterium DNF00751]|nr:hypothetical protein HMPREF3033_01843 [Veillonellaceae bacterium DNF00751]
MFAVRYIFYCVVVKKYGRANTLFDSFYQVVKKSKIRCII